MSFVPLKTRPAFPLVIAHRGARGHAPENTLAAAALGLHDAADLWELDVNMTLDGQLVVMHDDTLSRTTDVASHAGFASRAPYRVCDFTLEELRRLDAGSFYLNTDPFGRIAAGEVSDEARKSFAGLSIPTLEEALRLTRDNNWQVNVEIKDHAQLRGHEAVTGLVVALLRQMDMVEQVIVSSFQHLYLKQCRVLCPELATGALVEDVRPEDSVKLCRELGVNAYHPDRRLLDEEELARLRDAGFAVNVWTVNDMDEALRLTRAGATGMITDFPKACRTLFREQGLR